MLSACAAPIQTPAASPEPALRRDTAPLTQTTPSAVSVPFTVCHTVADWVRPTKAEQVAEIWSLPRYKGVSPDVLEKTFRQDFYRYYGGNSELFVWGELGCGTRQKPCAAAKPANRPSTQGRRLNYGY
jgi:hypothetical protein